MSDAGYVLAVGPVCIDEYYSAPSWVTEGSKLPMETGQPKVGGMIPNAACVFASLGVATKFFDSMNSGATSQMLLKDLQSYGLDTSPVYFDDAMADSKCIIIQTPGDRTILVATAQKPQLQVEGERLEVFRRAQYIYSTPFDMTQFAQPMALIDDVKAHGAKIVFDVEESNITGGYTEYLYKANILFFNEYGFAAFCDGKSEQACLDALFDAGVEIVTITLGKRGSRTVTRTEDVKNPAYDFPVVDPTGAGDTFNSSFVSCIMRGQGIAAAARFANMAASYAVSQLGPKGGAQSTAFVEGLFSEYEDKIAE